MTQQPSEANEIAPPHVTAEQVDYATELGMMSRQQRQQQPPLDQLALPPHIQLQVDQAAREKATRMARRRAHARVAYSSVIGSALATLIVICTRLAISGNPDIPADWAPLVIALTTVCGWLASVVSSLVGVPLDG